MTHARRGAPPSLLPRAGRDYRLCSRHRGEGALLLPGCYATASNVSMCRENVQGARV